MGGDVRIEVARAVDGRVRIDSLELGAGGTLADALAAAVNAGIVTAEALDGLAVAVYGKVRPPAWPLHDGDRVELLGPLRVDPKLARQRRVEHRRAAAPKDKWRPA